MPAATAMATRPGRRLLSAEEFLDWLQPGVRADLIQGETVMHSPVNLRHADLLNFVDRLMAAYIEVRKLGRLYREVVAVRLSPRQVFLPDLAFFTNEQVARLPATHAPFAPTLVVEALSLRTAHLDSGPKFAAYEQHGVAEYWILDPDHLAHEFFRREGEMLVPFAEEEPVIQSQAVKGFWLKRAWLNPRELPPVCECLAELGIGFS
jgi:Uma2 family endonuclease